MRETKKPPCPKKSGSAAQFSRRVLSAYPLDSASHFYSFVRHHAWFKNTHSRFDKFNHVKYTKTLSVRNWRTEVSCRFSECDARHLSARFQESLYLRLKVRPQARIALIARAFFAAHFAHIGDIVFTHANDRCGPL